MACSSRARFIWRKPKRASINCDCKRPRPNTMRCHFAKSAVRKRKSCIPWSTTTAFAASCSKKTEATWTRRASQMPTPRARGKTGRRLFVSVQSREPNSKLMARGSCARRKAISRPSGWSTPQAYGAGKSRPLPGSNCLCNRRSISISSPRRLPR